MIYYPLYPSKYYLLLVSKICKPPDLFLGLKCLVESKVQLLRCGIRDMCAAFPLLGFLAVQLVPCIHTLAVYTFLSLLYYSIKRSLCLRRQPADPVAFIWCLAHFLIFHVWPLSHSISLLSHDMYSWSQPSLIFSNFIWLCNPVC